MNKQTEHFLQALQDIEQGKVVPLDKALHEEPPSEELQKIFDAIEKMDAEREAWQKMFNLQSNLVVGLEMDKIRLEKRIETLSKENETLQGYLNNVHNNLKKMTGEQ
jgi:chaperonin cofactor prefoldin